MVEFWVLQAGIDTNVVVPRNICDATYFVHPYPLHVIATLSYLLSSTVNSISLSNEVNMCVVLICIISTVANTLWWLY